MKRKGEQFHPSRDVRDEGGQQQLFDPEVHEQNQRMALAKQRFQPGMVEDLNGNVVSDTRATQIRDIAVRQSRIPTSDLQPRRSFRTGEDLPETKLTTSNEGRFWNAGLSGWFRGPAIAGVQSPPQPSKSDVLAVSPFSPDASHTFVHEAGHRNQLGAQPGFAPTEHPMGKNPDPLLEGVADGYVDRYGGSGSSNVRAMKADIESGGKPQRGLPQGRGKFSSYDDPSAGYSTNEKRAEALDWTPPERALYAASRAHASETGEQHLWQRQNYVEEPPEEGFTVPQIVESWDKGGMADVDASLHHLLNAGPHAAQALADTGLTEVGEAASRRHMDRRLLSEGQSVQDSLFQEIRGTKSQANLGYVPNPAAVSSDVDVEARPFLDDSATTVAKARVASGEKKVDVHPMSHNQFGETPRTKRDVQKSLGVPSKVSGKRGFS
jgi:hypothetical protein